MDFLRDRRVILALGGALAVLAALGVAMGVKFGDRGPKAPPPASRGGLVVETNGADAGSLDPARPLRCFVNGQFVGQTTLADCARRNGVATSALDVGVDATGSIAAAGDAGAVLQPLPQPPAVALPQAQDDGLAALPAGVEAAPAARAGSACWRFTGGDWRRLPSDLNLNACVQALFAGHCERPGGASYGRWGEQTVRLVFGRVEVASDNRNFHTLAEQDPGSCAIGPAG